MTGIRALAWAVVIGVSLSASGLMGQAPGTRPSPSPAVESLCHSANHLKFLPEAQARQYRLRALALAAADREPASPQAAELLALIYRSSPDPGAPLCEALDNVLASRPNDFGLGWQWLNARVARTHNARERVALLTEIAAREALGAELRAEAAAQAGLVYEREGDGDKAHAMFAQALSLDPWNSVGLARAVVPATDRAALVRRFVRQLQGSVAEATGEPGPLSPLAAALDAAGLHEPSLTFFAEAWRWAKRPGQSDALRGLGVHYLNALLDAGEGAQAVGIFGPLEKDFADSVDFHALLAEACQLTGDAAGQARQVAAIEKLCPPLTPGTTTAAQAVELATFHLLLQPKPQAAFAEADYAQRTAGKDPDQQRRAQRVLGAAELASDKPDLVAAGEARLKALLGQDPYAAVFLAAHYFATAREGAGKETLAAAASITHSGPAFRRLRAMAKDHAVVLPEAKDAPAIREALGELDAGMFQMRAFPQRYVAVSLRPVSESVLPGEAIFVEARLTNISKAPVPLGGTGLLAPTMSLRARVTPGMEKPVLDLPLVVWAAPRMLPAGQSLTEIVRIDVGPLANFLARRPLDDLAVTIDGVLSPDPAGQSQVPDVILAPAKFHRTDLMGAFDRRRPGEWGAAYEQTLARIANDIRTASREGKGLAARQTGLLLQLARNVQAGDARPPEALEGKLNKPLLLRMMITLLQDPDETVRAEMLTALQDVPLDQTILRQLGPPLIEAPSPLVRLRLVELMGAAGLTGTGSIVQILAADPNERVRMMADGFIRASARSDGPGRADKVGSPPPNP